MLMRAIRICETFVSTWNATLLLGVTSGFRKFHIHRLIEHEICNSILCLNGTPHELGTDYCPTSGGGGVFLSRSTVKT